MRIDPRFLVAGCFLLTLLALTPAQTARAESDIEAAVAAARRERVERLAQIALDAHAGGLHGTRDEIYEAVLELDPDHAAARKRLRYRKDGDGWSRRGKYRRPKDRPRKDAADRIPAARSAHDAWWKETLLALFRKAHEAKAEATAEALRLEALELMPDNRELRAATGEVEVRKGSASRWVLPETQAGLARRRALLEAARKAVQALPKPTRSAIEKHEQHEGVTWNRALAGAGVRIVGGAESSELERGYEIAGSTPAVFEAVFGVRPRYPKGQGRYEAGYPVYVASSREEGDAYVRGEPGITERDLAYLLKLNSSYLVHRPGIVLKGRTTERRMEGLSRTTCGLFISYELGLHSRSKGAWALQAVRHYLAWLQVRRRQLFLAQDTRGARYDRGEPDVPDWKTRIKDDTTDWHALAAEALRSMKPSDVALMLGKGINQLDTRDVLAGYGFVVYAIEARPEQATAFLKALAKPEGTTIDAIFEKHLGATPEKLRPKLLRWLDEMAELADDPGSPR